MPVIQDQTGERSVDLTTPEEGVAVITVGGAPPNGCSFIVVEKIAARLAEARAAGARVVVLASSTPGHWLGHASLRDLHAMMTGGEPSGNGIAWFQCVQALSQGDLVSIAAVSGDTAGGGAEFGWACDLRVAARSARFAQPEVMIGLATGLGGTARLMRLIGRAATSEMVLDGAAVGAERLHALGAVNRVVDDGRCTDVAIEWASRIARRPPEALRVLKQILHESDELPLSEALANEQRRFQEIARTPAAVERMAAIQARYDAGERPDDVYEAPFEP